jgi:hypothetical protein
MRKLVLIALALLAVVLVAITLQVRNADRVVDLESRPLLGDEQLGLLDKVDHIELARSGQQVRLQRKDGRWSVASRNDFPIQRERLAALLLMLRNAKIIEDKTDNPAYHARLGLTESSDGEGALRISFEGEQGGFGLLFGNKIGNGQLARFVGIDQVSLINRPLAASVNSHDWLDLQVTQIPLEQIAQAHWRYADGEQVLLDKAKEGDYNFQLAGGGGEGFEREINAMVLALADLRAQEVSPRSDLQLVDPVLSMQLSTWAGARVQASLYELNGAYWLTIDDLKQSEDKPVIVHDDARWAFQLGVAQHDRMALRHADLKKPVPSEQAAAAQP